MPNYDPKTEISFGVISQNSLNLDTIDSWYENDSIYDEYVEDLAEQVKNGGMTEEEVDDILDNYQNDYQHFYVKDDGGISAEFFQDLDVWYITKSPFYTFCKKCSPCCPGAGDLDSPIDSEDYEVMTLWDKAYCLPKEYFENETAPYRVYRVDNDEEVI
jgi:hypothetical protein